MNILLTGGSGFIGRNILESYLTKKHYFTAPRHNELDFLDEGAVKNYFDTHDIDVVIHGAVRPGHRNAADPTGQLYQNTKMFFNIARNADRFRKMIYLGSGLVYDLRHYSPKMKEEYFDVHVPADEGGFSKYVIAQYIKNADNMVELRIFGIYGKYEDYAIRFISNAICKTLFDLPITIKQNRCFDYLYIDDLMQILGFFIQNDGHFKHYNITPDHTVELMKLAETIQAISGKDLPIKIAQDGMGIEYSGDNGRLRAEIPSLKLTRHEEAIRQLYAWYYSNKNSINRDLLLVDK
jgi:UDP-glucose 4-epimerase